jgi:hypothetical protein
LGAHNIIVPWWKDYVEVELLACPLEGVKVEHDQLEESTAA